MSVTKPTLTAVAKPETTLSPGHYDPRLSSEMGKLTGNWGLSNFPCETFSRNSIASKDHCRAIYFCELQELI